MTLVQAVAVFLVLISAIGWINVRFLRVSSSVAMLGAGLVGALVLLGAQTAIGPFWGFNDVRAMVKGLNFTDTVFDYLLSLLLFAGGMQVDLRELQRRRVAVWTLATGGVLVSTALVGFGVWAAAHALGHDLPLPWALTFGALISPTDPIAVMEAVQSGTLSKRLGAVLQGEALFNDGVGFVVFTAALAFAASGTIPHPAAAAGTIVLEAGGGLVLGVACAWVVVFGLRAIEDRVVEVTATIALAIGVYVVAGLLHLSGPIAAAAAGLVMGESGVKTAMSELTRRYVEGFWDLVDQILNAVLFLLLGLQVFVLPFQFDEVGLWLVAAALAIAARLIVVMPWAIYFRFRHEERGAAAVLTWGGLRGAISLALALSLPAGPYRETVLGVTFFVVVFSVVVQGMTFKPLARLARGPSAAAEG
jgi:CPA1 family monovalent cation:H+ antiporter